MCFTPFSYCCIPPPYFASSLHLPLGHIALNVAYYTKKHLIGVLTNDGVYIIRDKNRPADNLNKDLVYDNNSFEIVSLLKLPRDEGHYMQISFLNEDNIVLLAGTKHNICVIINMKIAWAGGKLDVLRSKIITSVEAPANLLSFSDRVFVQDREGKIIELTLSSSNDINSIVYTDIKLPKFLSEFSCFEVPSKSQKKPILIFIGITEDMKLYMNDTLLSSSCSSFTITKGFFIYTTYEDRLITCYIGPGDTVEHNKRMEDFDSIVKYFHSAEKYSRRVERGAFIVTSSEDSLSLILQMPRGNLECIQPRHMIIHAIRSSVDSLNYLEAYNIARRSCTDMNILVDINQGAFKTHFVKFVNQVDDSKLLNTFILALRLYQCYRWTLCLSN